MKATARAFPVRGARPASVASERFKAGVRRWAARIGVRPKRIQVQWMRTKWASCSNAGRICFSADLLREDAAFRQVVVVHELLHLLVPNHGKLFKSLLKAYLPRWEKTVRGQIGRSAGHRATKRQSRWRVSVE